MSAVLQRCRTYSLRLSSLTARHSQVTHLLQTPGLSFRSGYVDVASSRLVCQSSGAWGTRFTPSDVPSNLELLVQSLSIPPPKSFETKQTPSKPPISLWPISGKKPFFKPRLPYTNLQVEVFVSTGWSLLLDSQSSLFPLWQHIETHYRADKLIRRPEGMEKTLLLEVLDRIVHDWLNGLLPLGVATPAAAVQIYLERDIMCPEFWTPIVTRMTSYMFRSSTGRSDDASAGSDSRVSDEACLQELLRIWRLFFETYVALPSIIPDLDERSPKQERNLWPFLPLKDQVAPVLEPAGINYLYRFLRFVPRWRTDLMSELLSTSSQRIAICGAHTFSVLANRTIKARLTGVDQAERENESRSYHDTEAVLTTQIIYGIGSPLPHASDHSPTTGNIQDETLNAGTADPLANRSEQDDEGNGRLMELSCDEESYMYVFSQLISDTTLVSAKFQRKRRGFPEGFFPWLRASRHTLLIQAAQLSRELGQPKPIPPLVPLTINDEPIQHHLNRIIPDLNLEYVNFLWRCVKDFYRWKHIDASSPTQTSTSYQANSDTQPTINGGKAFDPLAAAAFVEAFLRFDSFSGVMQVCHEFNTSPATQDGSRDAFWQTVWAYVLMYCAQQRDPGAFRVAWGRILDCGLVPSPLEWMCILDALVMRERPMDALSVFDQMVLKRVQLGGLSMSEPTITQLIRLLIQQGEQELALRVLHRMETLGLKVKASAVGELMLDAMSRKQSEELKRWFTEAQMRGVTFSDSQCARLVDCNFFAGPLASLNTTLVEGKKAIDDIFALRYGNFRAKLKENGQSAHTNVSNETVRPIAGINLQDSRESGLLKAAMTKTYHALLSGLGRNQLRAHLAVWHHLIEHGINPYDLSEDWPALFSAIFNLKSPDFQLADRIAQFDPPNQSNVKRLQRLLMEGLVLHSQIKRIEVLLERALNKDIPLDAKTLSIALKALLSQNRVDTAERLIKYAEKRKAYYENGYDNVEMGIFWLLVRDARRNGLLSAFGELLCQRCLAVFESHSDLQTHVIICTGKRAKGFWGTTPISRCFSSQDRNTASEPFSTIAVQMANEMVPPPSPAAMSLSLINGPVQPQYEDPTNGSPPIVDDVIQNQWSWLARGQSGIEESSVEPRSLPPVSPLAPSSSMSRMSAKGQAERPVRQFQCSTCKSYFPNFRGSASARPCNAKRPFCCHCQQRFGSGVELAEHLFGCSSQRSSY